MHKDQNQKKYLTTRSVIIPEEYEVLNTSSVGASTEYSVTFRITDACNLKCDYCHWNSGINYPLEDIKKSIDKIMIFLKNQVKSTTFYYHGGEPSQHPDVLEILRYVNSFKEPDFIIIQEFQTNLTSKSKLLKEIYKEVDYVCVSLHWDELNKKNLLERFKKNIVELPVHQRLSLDIMQEPFDDLKELKRFHLYSKEILTLNFMNSEMINGFCHYSENNKTLGQHLDFYNKFNQTEQLYRIKEKDKPSQIYNTNDLFRFGLDCTGMQCDAGKNTVVVNGDGYMFVCGIAMTNYTKRCTNDKPFCNIITDLNYIKKWKVLLGGYKCKWNYCGGDFYLGKKNS